MIYVFKNSFECMWNIFYVEMKTTPENNSSFGKFLLERSVLFLSFFILFTELQSLTYFQDKRLL